VITLLADANIQGHIHVLTRRMQAEPYIGFWNSLQMSSLTFADVNLDPANTDAVIWHRCQERRIFLLTNNRNDDGPDSLESTIRTFNTPDSLPVFTIGDADRTMKDRAYSDDVIWALLGYLLQADNILGTGRLYLP
jgi:hypothetical protein